MHFHFFHPTSLIHLHEIFVLPIFVYSIIIPNYTFSGSQADRSNDLPSNNGLKLPDQLKLFCLTNTY